MGSWSWMVVWTVSTMVIVAGVACAAEPSQSAKPASTLEWIVAYSADLKNGKAVDNYWWAQSGTADITNGKLVFTPGRRGRLGTFLYSHRFPASTRIEMLISVPPNTKPRDINCDLLLNADVSVGTYDSRGYALQFRSRGKSCRVIRGSMTLKSVGADRFQWDSKKTYHIIAERNDGQISLSIDGKQILSATDDTPLESPLMNLVGITGSRCTLNLEKFVVYTRKNRPGDAIDLTAVPEGPQITIKGPGMCARGHVAKHGVFDGCPQLAIFAMAGSPKTKAEFGRIMDKFYPEKGLNVDQAARLLEEFDKRLKYYIVPTPSLNRKHTEHDYPSRILSVTGTVFERNGKKWISASEIGPAKIAYPARMLAPDKPFVMPDKEPLILRIADKLTLKCIKLPPGRYLRGSPFYEHPRWQDETPHEVVLTKSFYMSEIPITQEMFEAVVGKNPSKKKRRAWKSTRDRAFHERFRHKKPDDGPDYAVEHAEWADIQEFCKKLSEKNGVTVRVPTEGEWEYAARVGTSNPCFTERFLKQRSFVGDGEGRCEPVKRHEPNAWGLYDMVKSGWGLVSDYKRDNVREKQVDPKGPSRRAAANHGSGPLRRTKGGSYYDDTHLNLHGACDEHGNNEEGIMIFRVVVEAE